MKKRFLLFSRATSRLRYMAHWRCKEPIVIFESDDWGMERQASSNWLRAFGEPGEWADEQLESEEDLEGLFQVLARHQDRSGRPACFTANFVVANPDFEAIAQHQYSHYLDLPISRKGPLKDKWRQGFERRVFFPQYHARAHFWPSAWLRDLQEDVPGARELFDTQCPGGLSLLKGQSWRYHSEYIDWMTGEQLPALELGAWLSTGLEYFLECFGFFPYSTIAPNYIFTDLVARVWWEKGIRLVQGTGYRIVRQSNGEMQVISHALGERMKNGLLCLTRTVKFDPRPQRPRHGYHDVAKIVKDHLTNHLPLIIDTHRINYVGYWKKKALEELDQFLRTLNPSHVVFLTSVELGEAILNQGMYKDVWTGEMRHLTPIDTPVQKILRKWFQLWREYYANPGASQLR